MYRISGAVEAKGDETTAQKQSQQTQENAPEPSHTPGSVGHYRLHLKNTSTLCGNWIDYDNVFSLLILN